MALCECGCGRETRLAPYSDRGRGWVRGEPLRFLRGHSGSKWKRVDPRVSFCEKVVVGDDCWEWRGAHSTAGYAQISVEQRVVYAHRFAYEWLIGSIPDGMQLDHICRNRGCVKPAHLEPVTNAENGRRGGSAKLTQADAEAIRRELHRGDLDGAAHRYGITKRHVQRIAAGEHWR